MSDTTSSSVSFETLLNAIQKLDLSHKRELFDLLDNWILDAEEAPDESDAVLSASYPSADYPFLQALSSTSIE